MSLLVLVQVIAIRPDVTIVLVDSAGSCAICSFSDGSCDILGISVCLEKNSTGGDVDVVTL